MKKILILLASVILWFCLFVTYFILPANSPKSDTVSDFSRIEQVVVSEENHIQKVEEIKEAIQEAKNAGKKVSIAGGRFSWGGHIMTEYGMLIDMTKFNKILDYDPKNQQITVESGIRWRQIQEFIQKDNLAIWVMQSSSIFTVWGSMSANVHGRDPRFGTIVDSIVSFRLMWADGEILEVSRANNEELFSLVIWWYGLFWVITDVTLRLVPDENYKRYTVELKKEDYASYLKEKIVDNNKVGLHFWRLSFAPGENFLNEFFVTNYEILDENKWEFLIEKTIWKEQNVLRNRFFFNISREYIWGKKLRWFLQKKYTDNVETYKYISRNNAMNPPIEFISYYSKKDTDILQEYYVPLENFSDFVDDLGKILSKNNVNLLSVTTRYVPKNTEIFLDYNPVDMVAIVLYFNVWTSDLDQDKVKKYIQKIIKLTDNYEGRYYLTYQNYASKELLEENYSEFPAFLDLKKKYDPEELFSNIFYETYSK